MCDSHLRGRWERRGDRGWIGTGREEEGRDRERQRKVLKSLMWEKVCFAPKPGVRTSHQPFEDAFLIREVADKLGWRRRSASRPLPDAVRPKIVQVQVRAEPATAGDADESASTERTIWHGDVSGALFEYSTIYKLLVTRSKGRDAWSRWTSIELSQWQELVHSAGSNPTIPLWQGVRALYQLHHRRHSSM